MQLIIAFIIAKLLDPVGLIICFVAFIALKTRPWFIQFGVAVLASGIITETILTMSQYARDWGDGLAPSLLGGAVQALFG